MRSVIRNIHEDWPPPQPSPYYDERVYTDPHQIDLFAGTLLTETTVIVDAEADAYFYTAASPLPTAELTAFGGNLENTGQSLGSLVLGNDGASLGSLSVEAGSSLEGYGLGAIGYDGASAGDFGGGMAGTGGAPGASLN